MKKQPKEKTRLDFEGIELATFIFDNFHLLASHYAEVGLKILSARRVQKYLDKNQARIGENKINGLMAFTDSFRNSTGGRIHIIPAITGPVKEAFHLAELKQPLDYEEKSNYFLHIIEGAAEKKRPYAGNTHVHIYPGTNGKVAPFDLIDFLQTEHGGQNELQQITEYRPWVLIRVGNAAYWRNANADIISRLFSNL